MPTTWATGGATGQVKVVRKSLKVAAEVMESGAPQPGCTLYHALSAP